MNWKTWIPLVVAIALGLLAAKLGRDMLSRSHLVPALDTKVVKVVVAKQGLAPGHTLNDGDLTVGPVAADNVPAGAFREPAELLGRVVLNVVVKGQPVLDAHLAPMGMGGGLQALVPTGMRAVTLEVNEVSGVGGLLVPGCRVDMVSTLKDEQAKQAVVRTVVQDLKVLVVGQRMVVGEDESDKAVLAKSVTLLASPQDAEVIELASNSGRCRLVLRGATDKGPAETKGLTLAELLGHEPPAPVQQAPVQQAAQPTTQEAPAPPVAVKPPVQVEIEKPARRVIEVISGDVVARVEFEQSSASNVVSGNENEHAIPGR